MPNQAYRLRIRNAADSADALVVTSIAGGTNPYIAAPPSGDGQEVDLLTGAVRTGAYNVEVVDVATGTDGTGTIRVLTNQLNDSSATTARPHLLSRRAFVEMSTDGGSSWTAWCAGFISNIRQVDAIRYAITVSNTRRVEQTERVFTWQSKAERDAFPKRGCIFGGPIIGGLGGGTTRTIDSGGWTYLYKATTGTSTPVSGDTLALSYSSGAFYPLFEQKKVPGPNQNAQWWRSVKPYLKRVSGDASATGAAFTYLQGSEVFAMPDLTAIVTDPATGNQWLGEVRAINLGPSQAVAAESRLGLNDQNLYVKLYAPDTTWPTLPSANTALRVRVVTRQVSEASPVYIQAHPADVAKKLYEIINLTVNTAAYNAVVDALGANLRVTYRVTAAQTMAEFLEQSVFGPFGFAARVNSTGEVEFFPTRVLNYVAPTYTIATNDLVGDEPPAIYDLDEATVVTGYTLTQNVLTAMTNFDSDDTAPAPDGIVSTEQTLEYANGDTSTYSTRVVSYTVPGMVTDAESFVPSFTEWSRGVVFEGFNRFGRGAVNSEVAVLRTSSAAAAQVGDFVYLSASYYPNRNYRIGESSVGARVAQIVRREERPESVAFKLVDAGGFVQPATAATVSLAVSTADPRRVAQFTITNAGGVGGLNANNIGVAVEWATGASAPAAGKNGNLFTRYAPGAVPTGAVQLPAVKLGATTVHVRVRSEVPGIFPSAWSGWSTVTLNAWTAPTGVTVGTLTNETAAVSWSLNTNTTDSVDVYVAPGSVAPSDWTPYRVNTLPPGTTSTLLTGLSASTAYITGVAFRDRVANVAMTPVTATFTTAGVTTGTADRPAGLQVIAGVDDANLPQGVVLAIWPSSGSVTTILERALNVAGVPGTYAEIAVLPGTVTSYVDYLPKDGTTYWYRIKHRTAGKTDSEYVPGWTNISTTYYGVNAVATGVPPVLATVLPQEPIIVPSSAYINVGSPQFNIDITYTDSQHRVAFFEFRSRSRTTKTWGAWSAWTPYFKDIASRTSGTFSSITGLATTTTIYQVEWRIYGSDAYGNLSYIRSGNTEWPQNYGQNKPIIKVQKQGYNAGSSKYEVWWRFYFDRGNSTLDEDGDQNTQQTFTTQVIAASVKDQSGTTATNVVTSGTKTADGWKATWDSTAGQSWVFEVSVDTAMPTQYYLQYQDTDVLDEQLVAPTSGQTFSAPAASATATTGTLTLGSYLTGGSYNGSANVTTTVDATTTNTASKVVARDASGNFSAGTITATLNGAAPAGSLTGTTLASNVVNSSLTSVGTLTGLTVSGASTLFNTGNAVGTLTLGTTAAVTQEQRFRLTNSVATGGVELVLNSAATLWGLYDRTASKWALQITRGATDAVSIPGSLAVTNALSTSSTLQASSYAAVGGAVSANAQIYVRGTMAGSGTNQYAALVQTTFPVAATSGMHGVFVATIGAAGTYTTTNVIGVNVQPHTLGAGQTVTNAYSVFIGASSHAATTKYGIQIDSVTGGTTNYALYTGTGQVRLGDNVRIVNGSLSISTAPNSSTTAIQVGTDHALLTSSTSYGMLMQPTAQGTVTNLRAIEARVVISATTALAAAFGAYIRTPTIPAGGTIALNYGLHIEAQTGATTNYAIYTNAGLVRFGDAVSVVGNVNLSSGSAFQINSTNVLTATALGTGVTASSLTSVGTLSSLTVSGDLTVDTSTLKVDSTNNRVGIGTATPGYTLDSVSGDGNLFRFDRSGVQIGAFVSATNPFFGTLSNSPLLFMTNSTERMRLDASGNVGIGTTSPGARLDVAGGDVLINGAGWNGSRLCVTESSGSTAEINGTSNTANQSPLYVWNNVESGSTYFISFYSDGQNNARTLRGYINYRRDNATLNLTTASDYRIKTIHGPYTKSGEVFDKIRMHEGTINGEQGRYPMVLAHELAEAYPSAVEGEKDAVNEDGTPKLQMVSYNAMIPLMLAEIKSLRERVAQLENR
jgi:hypothetical protein